MDTPLSTRPHWTPEHPNLYDVELRVVDGSGKTLDKVSSYFGMRKIHTENGRVYLNNRPLYMRLVLDQGYWPDGLLTAPTDEALKKDIELAKAMGFNGARKHQKVEDPRYLYWADKLGFFVWGEMASAYQYSPAYAAKITREWIEVIERDYNHPSIICWVPLNESWGIINMEGDERQRHHATAMYYLTKSLDPTRLVISNDGWEHTISDLLTIHDYDQDYERFYRRWSDIAERSRRFARVDAGRVARSLGPSRPRHRIRRHRFESQRLGRLGLRRRQRSRSAAGGICQPHQCHLRLQGDPRLLLHAAHRRGARDQRSFTYDRKPKAPLEKIREITLGRLKYPVERVPSE